MIDVIDSRGTFGVTKIYTTVKSEMSCLDSDGTAATDSHRMNKRLKRMENTE